MRFASDNSGPVHPNVMDALARANDGWALPYGNEEITQAAADAVRDVFEAPNAAVYFVATGSAANALLLPVVTTITTAWVTASISLIRASISPSSIRKPRILTCRSIRPKNCRVPSSVQRHLSPVRSNNQ